MAHAVVLGDEACRTIVAALDEMQRYTGDSEACTARHTGESQTTRLELTLARTAGPSLGHRETVRQFYG